MNSKHETKNRRTYRSALREQQAAETRALILKALGEVLGTSGPGEFSVQDVAQRAGVTTRTVYRHFASRAELMDALQRWVAGRAIPSMPTRLEDLWNFPEALFSAFDRHALWVDAVLQAGPGAEVRAVGKAGRVAAVRHLLSDLTRGLNAELGVWASGVVKHLLSAEAWRTLRTDFGLDGPSAGRAVRWALEALVNDLQRRQRSGGDDVMNVQCSQADLLGLSYAVAAAAGTGLLAELIERGGESASSFAQALGIDARATGLVLDALVATGMATRAGEAYSPSARLIELNALMAGGLALNLMLWEHTATFLRTGEPLIAMDGDTGDREARYRTAVGGLAKLFAAPARTFASLLPSAPARVLDVGCGSGVWSLAVAQRFPEARITGQDLPGVLDVFEATASELGLRDRIERLEGDMHSVTLPEAHFDLAILANVVRLEPAERVHSLLGRLAKAVRPGGAVVIIDALAGGTPEREVSRAVYALHLALRTRNGRVHPPEELRRWLGSVGIGEVRALDLGLVPGAVGALLGVKG